MNDQDFKDMVKSSLDRIERPASENNARFEKRIDSIDTQTKELKEDQITLKISQQELSKNLMIFSLSEGSRGKLLELLVPSLLILRHS